MGAICLAAIIPVIRPFVLSFGYSEIAAVALVGLAMVATLSWGATLKGLVAAMIGLLLDTIGTAPAGGAERFTWDSLSSAKGCH